MKDAQRLRIFQKSKVANPCSVLTLVFDVQLQDVAGVQCVACNNVTKIYCRFSQRQGRMQNS